MKYRRNGRVTPAQKRALRAILRAHRNPETVLNDAVKVGVVSPAVATAIKQETKEAMKTNPRKRRAKKRHISRDHRAKLIANLRKARSARRRKLNRRRR